MSKAAIIGVIMFVMLSGNLAKAADCEIVNGSFEDGFNGWDVNIPDKFTGYVDVDWPTDGSIYSLTLRSEFWEDFTEGDIATVTQQVFLDDANEIVFDVKLSTWDPNIFSAVVLIEDDEVWSSDGSMPGSNNEYHDATYTVEDKYRIAGPYKLSLGIRVNKTEFLYKRYITYWDSIRCTAFCGGSGYPRGDINLDCVVDMNDMAEMAGLWLEMVDAYDVRNLSGEGDLSGYGIINFMDFAFIAGELDGDMSRMDDFVEKWLGEVEPDDIDNVFHEDDVGPKGVINFFDFAELAEILKDGS